MKSFLDNSVVTILAAGLLISLTLNMIIISRFNDFLLDTNRKQIVSLAENLNNQIFLQFVVPIALAGDEIALKNPDQFKELDEIVANFNNGLTAESVTIFYSRENVISYSTINELVGKKNRGGIEYHRALDGISTTTLDTTGSFFTFLTGKDPISYRLTAFIPLQPEKSGDQNKRIIMGATEYILDLSKEFQQFVRYQAMVFCLIVLIVAGFIIKIILHKN